MDKTNKVIKLSDEKLECVTGGYAIQGEDRCPHGYLYASASTCNETCSEYGTHFNGAPRCEFYCVAIK